MNAARTTDGLIAKIWPAWCALPADFDPQERITILEGRQLHYGDYRQQYSRLRRRFKNLLPLSGPKYDDALKVASAWWRLMDGSRACVAANTPEIERQLRYESFDRKLVGFVASYRMHTEFDIQHPDLVRPEKCPTLANLDFVRSRHLAYEQARRDAVGILSTLIFKTAIINEWKAGSFWQPCKGDFARFPRHLVIARLRAHGKCSDRLFTWFMKHDFPSLAEADRQAFSKECSEPKIGREDYSYLRLWAWLAENAPVFNSFKVGWPGIFKEVALRFKPSAPEGCRSHPVDSEQLKIQWRDFTILHGLNTPPRICPPKGPPRKNQPGIPSALLSPVPDFSIRR